MPNKKGSVPARSYEIPRIPKDSDGALLPPQIEAIIPFKPVENVARLIGQVADLVNKTFRGDKVDFKLTDAATDDDKKKQEVTDYILNRFNPLEIAARLEDNIHRQDRDMIRIGLDGAGVALATVIGAAIPPIAPEALMAAVGFLTDMGVAGAEGQKIGQEIDNIGTRWWTEAIQKRGERLYGDLQQALDIAGVTMSEEEQGSIIIELHQMYLAFLQLASEPRLPELQQAIDMERRAYDLERQINHWWVRRDTKIKLNAELEGLADDRYVYTTIFDERPLYQPYKLVKEEQQRQALMAAPTLKRMRPEETPVTVRWNEDKHQWVRDHI